MKLTSVGRRTVKAWSITTDEETKRIIEKGL